MYQLRQNVDIGICMQVFMILFQLILNSLTYSSARFVPHSNRHIDDNMPGTDVTMPNCSIYTYPSDTIKKLSLKNHL